MASTDALTEWKAIAEYHRAALEKGEAHIKELETPSAPVEPLLTKEEMRKRVLDMHKTNKLAIAWKKVVEKGGLVENVQGILWESYDSLYDKERSNVENASQKMGELGSIKWQLFVLKVIHYLKENKSFENYREGEFNNYEDTADGCDEIAWDAAIYLLDNPDWQPTA
jgi:hypothetical protein